MTAASPALYLDETPERRRARLTLSIMNAAMAAFIGAMIFGPWTAVIGALAMATLPYAQVLWRVIPEWAQANVIAAGVAVFLLCAILGTIIWGMSVAFYIALALVPVMLAIIPAIALNNPPLSDLD
jgi:hypothetical protein